MSKYKIVKAKDDGTEEVLKDDIRNIVYVAETGEEEENYLDFGITTNKLKTDKVALMKFIFEREITKLLTKNYENVDELDNPAAAMKKIFDMI